MSLLTFKIGDTWRIDGTRTDASGAAVNLSGWTVACEMRPLGGSTRTAFVGTVVSAPDGTYTLTLGSDVTETLAPGTYEADIEFRRTAPDPDDVQSTQTFAIRAIEDITNAA